MLKKRIIAGVLVVLSFFVLGTSASAFSLFGKKEEVKVEENTPRLKVYMPTEKIEPEGDIKSRISGSKGTEKSAQLLYDGKTSKAVEFENDATVTIDMGKTVMMSHVRYYAGKIKEDGNNCLGTRFYASNDNKTYSELAVIEDTVIPEDGWYEISFSGFGEYRYFRVMLPAMSNVCEIEWMGVSGFSREKQANGKYNLGFDLCAFDAVENIEDATVLVAEYNSNGVVKKIDAMKQSFLVGEITSFKAEIKNAEYGIGDSYRIAVFEKDGNISLQNPLNYRVNGATHSLSVSAAFGDNMVLQADKPAIIWGKAPKDRTVEVTIKNALGGSVSRTVQADVNSNWEVNLGSFSAGGKYDIIVKGDGTKLEYKNITFGDVWLCTGQSNMEFYMAGDETAAGELKDKVSVQNENIRLLNLFGKGMEGAASPVDNPPTGGDSWHEMDTDVASYCSAVGYFFAKEIQNTTDQPVGIINVAVGDTEINRWVSKGQRNGTFTSTDGDLYNNRIYPFEKLNIKGIILYQGEADQYRTHMTAKQYSDAMAGLVNYYRSKWGADLPFYWAQLTRYRIDETLVREGQRIALSKIANKNNTGMIVLNDLIGEYGADKGSCRNDIHPWDKKTVAERFAAYAKRDCYGQETDVTGPVFKSVEKQGNKLVLTFECKGELTVMPKERYADKITDEKIKKEKIDTSKPMEFEVAGSDGKYVKADAEIEGSTVILTSDSVKNPIYARYAWGAYPEMPNLTDETGLPTATFTTEDLS